jgi:hypothetical protein
MVRKDGAEAKKERMEQIARAVQAALHKDEEIPLSKTIAQIEYDFGLTREKIWGYLQTLEKLGQFMIDEDGDKIKKTSET